jgi:ubiquinone/menaquinone biosynthesis C-methylase UbiE
VAALERYRWAVDILDVQPDDVILEIGCGYGHSIPLIGERLSTGKLTAIDRSEKMTSAASEPNKEFIESGRAEILNCDLLDHALPASSFDKVFLFNINVFWMDPASELAEIRRLLKPDGRLFIFHQPPPGHDLDEFQEAFRANLAKYDFHLADVFKEPLETIRSVAVISKPIRQ